MNHETLERLHETFSESPAWLSKMIDAFNLTESDIEHLQWLDDNQMETQRLSQPKIVGKKTKWWEKRSPELLEAQLIRRADPVMFGCETDEESLAIVNKLVFQLENEYQRLFKNDATHFEKQLFLWASRYDYWRKQRNKIRSRQLHSRPDSQWPYPSITDQDIERARTVPFESITEPIRGYIECLWHDDSRPSMWVKNGFGYCFACMEWCDPIKWWMKKNGRNFVDTVRSLCQI